MKKLHTLSLEISNPCNERCVHCYRADTNATAGFLSADDAKSVLRQAKELGAVNCTVTGGEALLNPDWKNILNCADGLEFRTSLFTNGTLLDEEAADFIATIKNLKEVQISLYAMDAATHDAVTQVKGSFKNTFSAIKLLREQNVPIFISCPAMQTNKNAVADVMRWADAEKIGSCVDLLIFGATDGSGINLHEQLTEDDLENFFHVTMQDNGALSYVWGRKKEKPDLSEVYFHGGSSLCVNGSGDIFPQIGWYEKLGNIKEITLQEAMATEKFTRLSVIKASDFEECRSCEATDRCTFCPSPHVTAHGTDLQQLDTEHCKYVRNCKAFMERRDREH